MSEPLGTIGKSMLLIAGAIAATQDAMNHPMGKRAERQHISPQSFIALVVAAVVRVVDVVAAILAPRSAPDRDPGKHRTAVVGATQPIGVAIEPQA